MKNFRAVFLLCGMMLLPGCAGIALTAGSMATGQGLNHTLSGISYKTFATPLDEMRVATFRTLDRLGMDVTGQVKTEFGWSITAVAYKRIIDIELEALTSRATRMRVVANKGDIFFKDAATATEIIIQTVETLQMEMEAVYMPVSMPPDSVNLIRRY